jgi:hypothetical protein
MSGSEMPRHVNSRSLNNEPRGILQRRDHLLLGNKKGALGIRVRETECQLCNMRGSQRDQGKIVAL